MGIRKTTVVKLAVLAWAGTTALQVQARPAAMDPALVGADSDGDAPSAANSDALPYIQCVPYARKVSGINLYGDAHTWWDQAQGRYARGERPRIGAVMSFRPSGAMRLGHVAAVSRIIDARTVLLRHANWSPINGRRGQTEDNVRAVDVSPGNDWSEVRVWYAPLGSLGTTHWPVNGFIYNARPRGEDRLTVLASADRAGPDRAGRAALAEKARSRIGADFLKGIVPEQVDRPRAKADRQLASYAPPARMAAQTKTTAPRGARSLRDDPIGRIIAERMR